MNDKIKILPSMMCAHSKDLAAYVNAFEEVGVDAIHFDVMDGHYVPNIMLGASDFDSVRELSSLPIDIHLMCLEPEKFVDYFHTKENDWMSFHPEVCSQPCALLQRIRKKGMRAGYAISPAIGLDYIRECLAELDFILIMAVNPGFAGQTMLPDHLDKIKRIKEITNTADHKIDIIIDGNTTIENAQKMIKAGASGLVTGTSSMLKKGPDGFEGLYKQYMKEIG